jgi:hypothetical protein
LVNFLNSCLTLLIQVWQPSRSAEVMPCAAAAQEPGLWLLSALSPSPTLSLLLLLLLPPCLLFLLLQFKPAALQGPSRLEALVCSAALAHSLQEVMQQHASSASQAHTQVRCSLSVGSLLEQR